MKRIGLLAAVAAAAIATSSRAADYTFSFEGNSDHPGSVSGTIYGLADSGTSDPTSVMVSGGGAAYTFASGADGISFDGDFTIVNGAITMDTYTIRHSYPDTFEGQSVGFNTVSGNYFEDDPENVVIANDTGISSVTFTLIPGTSSAPEPSSWALMLAGVGLVGFALRARRRLSSIVA